MAAIPDREDSTTDTIRRLRQAPLAPLSVANAHASFNDNSITDNSKNVNYHNYSVVDNRTSATFKQAPLGLDILRECVVTAASYDSSERQSAAPCLPGTRAVVLDRIYKWVDSRDDSAVYWLHGPGGSGKTTIATTVATKYAELNRLAGSFFFSRDPAHHPGRRSTKGVIATIAYQNCVFHPFLKKRIERILDSDPSIIDKSFEIQLNLLIVSPLHIKRLDFIPRATNAVQIFFELCATFLAWMRWLDSHFGPLYSNHTLRRAIPTLYEISITCIFCIAVHPSFATITHLAVMTFIVGSILAHSTIPNILRVNIETFLHPPPIVVVIDALDECRESVGSLIKALAHEYRESPPRIRFLVTGRPEEAIEGKFRLYSDRTHFVNLMDFRAHDDIRASLRDGFDKLNVELSEYLMSVKKPWPSLEDIEALVNKSEGLFIYASTLLKFVQCDTDSNHNGHPAKRLKMAMQQHDGLDGLYRQVLWEAPHSLTPKFKRILGALCFLRSHLDLESLATFLQLDGPAELRQILRGCKSILRIPQMDTAEITFYHASLHDFFTNEKRSRVDYYIDAIVQHLSLLDYSIQIVIKEGHLFRPDLATPIKRPPTPLALKYALRHWHLHLLEIYHITEHHEGASVINILNTYFDGERYEHVFLYFLHFVGDATIDWRWMFRRGSPDLVDQLLELENGIVELSAELSCIRQVAETIPQAQKKLTGLATAIRKALLESGDSTGHGIGETEDPEML